MVRLGWPITWPAPSTRPIAVAGKGVSCTTTWTNSADAAWSRLTSTRRCGNTGVYLALGYATIATSQAVFQPEAINTAFAARFSVPMIDNDTIGLLNAIA